MPSSFAAGPPLGNSDRYPAKVRGALGMSRVFALLVLALVSVAAPPARAGRVQEYGPPTKSADCDRCRVQMVLAEKMRALSVKVDVIELKDGVGVVYRVDDPSSLSRVYRAATRARDELQHFCDHPADCRICSFCKASYPVFSKLKREVVLTSDNVIFFMRSDDREAVRALKDWMAKVQKGERAAPPAPSR